MDDGEGDGDGEYATSGRSTAGGPATGMIGRTVNAT